jgi:hypothetical protein
MVNSNNCLYLSCFFPFGNAGELQMRRYQGFEVEDYVFTLDALPLKPSRVCNIGDKCLKMPKFFVCLTLFNDINDFLELWTSGSS